MEKIFIVKLIVRIPEEKEEEFFTRLDDLCNELGKFEGLCSEEVEEKKE